MQRRPVLASLASLGLAPLASFAASTMDLAALERRVQGRLGFFAIDTGSGRTLAHRADERFAMASTFKSLLAARVAHGVDNGRWGWNDEVAIQAADRVPHSPAFDRFLPRGRATLAELCAGIVIESDNPCANVLLRHCGDGPAGLTAWLREQGDAVTRLDRFETELNENAPGDARDTSTPRALAKTLRRLLLDGGLSRASQARLWADLQASRTGLKRLRAGAPDGWRVIDKTGTGSRGAVNDVALVFPPGGRSPWVVVALQSDSRASTDDLSAVHAEAMRRLVKAWA
ncbi:class A beta-lactamase [Roseateles asaccharophilus]|uniref:beta-lactamase n=1 Tax=Roseateles asaccharophilus TaxID=582607 RepID=A0ABU2AEV9_9BURK|nr:class A beta-lactamase [Roseateles asaccharophilus]MDR7335752.1 beta-lactamase class A [Roseateles asaccharophilus]